MLVDMFDSDVFIFIRFMLISQNCGSIQYN